MIIFTLNSQQKIIYMRYLKIFFFSFFVLSTLNTSAQKSNTEKILGCWTFKEIQFSEKVNFEGQIIKWYKNNVLCFNSDGECTSTNNENKSKPFEGSYKISEDEKTLTQKWKESNNSEEENSEIKFLDNKLLVFKVEFGTMTYKRK